MTRPRRAVFAAFPVFALLGLGTLSYSVTPSDEDGPRIPGLSAASEAGEGARLAPIDPSAPRELVGPIVNTYTAARSFNGDLRRIANAPEARPPLRPELGAPSAGGSAPTTSATAAVQSSAALAPTASTSFAGLDYSGFGNGFPADPSGDIGPNHYIEGVNTSIGIFDKSTGERRVGLSFNAFFEGAGLASTDPCASQNYGDPYVLFDRYSGRWFISDFAFPSVKTGPYYQCIAVSKDGADPVNGGWWIYTFLVSNTLLNDYPKFASWKDGIYMTANMFKSGSSYYGAQATVFNRSDLISGAALHTVSFVLPYTSTYGYPFGLLAANDVSTNATGPEYLYSDFTGGLKQWTFTTDWTTPTNSTMSTARSVPGIPSYSKASGSAPQKDTSKALDQLGDRLMSAAQWSDASGVPSVWISRSAATAAGPTGILWMEIRAPGANVRVNQSGLFAPNDGLYRFMPSLAVNKVGTMAVGYSTSSSTTFPSLSYAARTITGAWGTLDLGEGLLHPGSGSQTSYSRWGDYFSMSVDPADGCAFWMVGSHLNVTGNNWQTRITKFDADCTPIPAPAIASFTPASAPTGSTVTVTGTNFLSGATVKFNGVSATNVTVTSPTTLTAVVPSTATTGKMSVTSVAGTATTGSDFTVVVPSTFAVSASPTSVTVAKAKAGSGSTITVTSTGTANTGSVTLSAPSLPGGVSASFNPTTVAGTTTSTTSTVTFTASKGAKTGTYTVTITGISATYSASTTLTLVVTN